VYQIGAFIYLETIISLINLTTISPGELKDSVINSSIGIAANKLAGEGE